MAQVMAATSAALDGSAEAKPRLSLLRIIEMNLGFLGLQFSFGLQQGNMAPIYSYLGANEASLPILQLAGPMTGLIVQPIIGAMSDRTNSRWGRRTPSWSAPLYGASRGARRSSQAPAARPLSAHRAARYWARACPA